MLRAFAVELRARVFQQTPQRFGADALYAERALFRGGSFSPLLALYLRYMQVQHAALQLFWQDLLYVRAYLPARRVGIGHYDQPRFLGVKTQQRAKLFILINAEAVSSDDNAVYQRGKLYLIVLALYHQRLFQLYFFRHLSSADPLYAIAEAANCSTASADISAFMDTLFRR